MFGARSRTISGRLSIDVNGAAAPKLAASIAIAQPGPAAATSAPPSAAPKTLAAFSAGRSRAFACWIIASGTVCVTIPCEAGKKNAAEVPFSTLRTTSCQISALPVSRSAATFPCVAMLTTFEVTMTARRGSRSAITPPRRMNAAFGIERAARTRPSSVLEPCRLPSKAKGEPDRSHRAADERRHPRRVEQPEASLAERT
jgi:hypothetical protein